MSDTVLRDEIIDVLNPGGIGGYRAHDERVADRILAIPAIKEALAFHEAAQSAFETLGEFTITRENVRGKGGVSAS